MARLSRRLESMPPVECENDIFDKMVAVKVEGHWLRASGFSNGVVHLFDLGMKKRVSMSDIRHAVDEMRTPQITFWCVLANFFAHCGPTNIEDILQSMVHKILTYL